MKGRFFSFMPLYSIQAWGKFYGPYPFGYMYPAHYSIKGYAIYQRRHTFHGIICIKEKYYNAPPRNVPWLAPYQNKLAEGVSVWKTLTPEDKQRYNNYSYPTQMSGYNRFLHYYMREFEVVFEYLLCDDNSYLLLDDGGRIII